MKLLRFGPAGQERPAMLDDQGGVRDLSGYVADFRGEVLSPDGLDELKSLNPGSLPLVEGWPRLGPRRRHRQDPRHRAELSQPRRGNRSHARRRAVGVLESDHRAQWPQRLYHHPPDAMKTDWEVELAVVIGTKAQYVKERNALDYVAGYAVINDVSSGRSRRNGRTIHQGQERRYVRADWSVARHQGRGSRPAITISLARREWAPAPNRQDLRNDFPVAFLISHLSHFMTLLPGDVIATGTPAGVGAGCTPRNS